MEDFYKTNDDTLGISATEFVNEWYNQQEYMFADIREPSEKADADSVKGTFNIPMSEIPDQIDYAPTHIICLMLCQDGSKAEQATKYLKNNGYKNMIYIEGGFNELLKAVPDLKG